MASVETLHDAIYEERRRENPAFDPVNATSATVTRMEILPTLAKVAYSRTRNQTSNTRHRGSAGGRVASGSTPDGGGGGGVGPLQSFSPGLAQLLHDTRSYTKFPSRGVTVDKESAISSDDDGDGTDPGAGGGLRGGSGSGGGGGGAHASYSSVRAGGGSAVLSGRSATAASTATPPAAVEDDIEDDSDF